MKRRTIGILTLCAVLALFLNWALLIPAGTFIWSLVERSSWSNWILAATGPTIIVMVYRMNFIWYYQ